MFKPIFYIKKDVYINMGNRGLKNLIPMWDDGIIINCPGLPVPCSVFHVETGSCWVMARSGSEMRAPAGSWQDPRGSKGCHGIKRIHGHQKDQQVSRVTRVSHGSDTGLTQILIRV